MTYIDDNKYWMNYYDKNKIPNEESSFARYIIEKLDKKLDKNIIDVGCGNGRDSIFFAKNNINTVGVDFCLDEIKFLNAKYKADNLNFQVMDMANMGEFNFRIDYIYTRLSLHSINEKDEDSFLKWVYDSLINNGYLFLEARSDKDKMLTQGVKISNNENYTDHYRRYLNYEQTKNKLINLKFDIVESTESDNLSVVGDDNPYLIRIIACKK